MKFSIPIKLPSLANQRMHWRAMVGQKLFQRAMTKCAMRFLTIPIPPIVVTITRIGPRSLDGDNLQGACKYVRDEIARAVGVDDGSPLYTWRYEQRKDKGYGVDVEIVSREG